MAHLFFASYARLDNPRAESRSTDRGPLGKVAEQIAERIRAKLGTRQPPEKLVFFDTTDIKTGRVWQEVLGGALKASDIIVAFCSPTYFNSLYRAKEFEVFRRRIEASSDAIQKRKGVMPVVPVVWERGPIPAVVSKFQNNDDDFPARYRQDGLAALNRVKSQRDNLKLAIEAVADRIVQAAIEPTLPAWSNDLDFDELPRAFHNPKPVPFSLAVAVLHSEGLQWDLNERGKTVAALVDDVASALRLPWREIDSKWMSFSPSPPRPPPAPG